MLDDITPVVAPIVGVRLVREWPLALILLRLDARLWIRCAASSSSFLCKESLGSNIARSSSYGSPRCRPRICMAMITIFEITLNSAEKDASMFG